MHTMTRPRTRAPNSRRKGMQVHRLKLSMVLASLIILSATAESATPEAKPAAAAKFTGKAEAAGIIVLDGKSPPATAQVTPPDKGGNAATGIGLGGCAACDTTTSPGEKKPAATAREKAAGR